MTGVPATGATREAAWRALHDPATDAATLARIAAAHPEFAAQIGRHPNVYPDLRAWAAQAGVAEAMTGSVETAVSASADAATSSASRRSLWTIALLVVMAVQLLTGVLGLFLEEGTFISSLWWLRPLAMLALMVIALISAPTVGRKIGASVFGALAVVVALGLSLSPWTETAYLGLPLSLLWLFVFLCWALARPVRGAGYAVIPFVVILPAVLSYVSTPLRYSLWLHLYYGTGPFSTSESASGSALDLLMYVGLLLLGSVGLPLAIAGMARAWSRASERRMREREQAREAAGASYPAAAAPAYPRTNTMAVLAIVFAFVFSILGIVFGHTALGQIRRTGEEGRGLAIAGLVIGYSSIGLGLLLLIVYAVALGLIH